jgi:hypothetical protein
MSEPIDVVIENISDIYLKRERDESEDNASDDSKRVKLGEVIDVVAKMISEENSPVTEVAAEENINSERGESVVNTTAKSSVTTDTAAAPLHVGGIEEGAPKETAYKGPVVAPIVRTFEEEMQYIKKLTPWKYEISKGFVPGMNVEGTFYVNDALIGLITDELKHHCETKGYGGFLPAVKQIANVAALPGIVKRYTYICIYIYIYIYIYIHTFIYIYIYINILPGIVKRSVALPDCHSGYGFAIGISPFYIIPLSYTSLYSPSPTFSLVFVI